MANKASQIPGQRSVFELETAPAEHNLNSLNSFARMATPHYWNMDYEDFAGYGYKEAKLIDPQSFLKRLHGTYRMDTPFKASYLGEDRNTYTVAMTQEQHKLLSRSVEGIADAALSTTLASRPREADIDHHQATAERSGVHVLDTKKKGMTAYLDGTLVGDQEVLERLMEASENPGKSRGKEDQFRIDAEWFKGHILQDMLQTLRQCRVNGKKWDQDRYERAKKIIDYRFFIDRTDNRHLTFWQDMLSVAYLHNEQLQNLFEDRIHSIDREVEKRKPLGIVR